MRILFWSEYFWPSIGGAEVLGANALLAMRERGHTCSVVTEQISGYDAYDEFFGIPVHRFPFAQALRGNDPRQVLGLRACILQLKRTFRPDLIWIHSCVAQSFFHLSTHVAAPAPVLLTLLNGYPDEAVRPDTALGMLLRGADRIVTNSSAVMAWALRQAPEIRPRCSLILNALEPPAIGPAPLPFDPPLLLSLGRLIEGKGVDTALSALALLHSPFPRLRLRIAGDGPARMSLEQQARTLGIATAVEFCGWVGPAEVPALLNAATMVVIPSRVFEGQTLVALQAAQMARPVVATRSGGLPEAVLDGQTGIVIEKDDPRALAEAIARLLREPALAQRLGQTARRRVVTEFTLERHIAAHERLIEELVHGASASSYGHRNRGTGEPEP
jgi:glycogen(starch) synthase